MTLTQKIQIETTTLVKIITYNKISRKNSQTQKANHTRQQKKKNSIGQTKTRRRVRSRSEKGGNRTCAAGGGRIFLKILELFQDPLGSHGETLAYRIFKENKSIRFTHLSTQET